MIIEEKINQKIIIEIEIYIIIKKEKEVEIEMIIEKINTEKEIMLESIMINIE